jgi:hypothetical protein
MITVGRFIEYDILNWIGLMLQSQSMYTMCLIVRAWYIDHDYFDPTIGVSYFDRRKYLILKRKAEGVGVRSVIRVSLLFGT